MSVAVTAVETAAGIEALGPAWRRLHDEAGGTPFQSWEWHRTWWRHLGRGAPLVLTAWRGPALVGLLPLRRHLWLGLRRVTFLGAPEADYQDLLAPPQEAAACAAAFLAHLAALPLDLVDLTDLPAASPLCEAATPPGLRRALRPHRLCRYAPLPASEDAFLAGLGRSQRAALRRRRRQLQGAFAVRMEAAAGQDVPAAVRELGALHGRRWRRRLLPGVLPPRTVRFHEELACRFAARGWLRLHRLRLDGVTRAAFYCFHHRARTYYYLSGFDPDLARYSPGAVLCAHAVAAAIAEGDGEFDFLRGDLTYKYRWTSAERRTVRLQWTRRTLASALARLLCAAGRGGRALVLSLRRRIYRDVGPPRREAR